MAILTEISNDEAATDSGAAADKQIQPMSHEGSGSGDSAGQRDAGAVSPFRLFATLKTKLNLAYMKLTLGPKRGRENIGV